MSLKSTLKGILGEAFINVGTWLMLDKNIYHRINNVTLPLADGGSTQIDHVIVSKFGIFVIETKNYKGWIFGSERQAQWTQSLYGKKYKFQNPLRQNYLHIKTLSDLLELEEEKFHSVIAFIGDCQIKTRDKLPKNVLASGWIPYIKDKQRELLTSDQVKSIVEHIDSERFAKSWKTNAKHKAYVKQKIDSKVTKNQANPLSASEKTKTQQKSMSDLPTMTKQSVPVNESVNTKPAHSNTEKFVPGGVNTNQPAQTESLGETNPFDLTESSTLPQRINAIFEQTQTTPVNAEPNNITEAKQNLIATTPPNCPKCGSDMVEREAKRGARKGQQFWGCSQFPKCRGIVQ